MTQNFVTFGGLKERLKRLIYRPRQFTDEMAGEFINQAIANLERNLRISSMERVLFSPPLDGVQNFVMIPPDLLEEISVFDVNNGEYEKVTLDEFLKRMRGKNADKPCYTKVADRFMFHPVPQQGTIVHIYHYGESMPLAVNTDANTWTRSATDAVLYAAAFRAALEFQDDARAQLYKGLADEHKVMLEVQDISEEMAGANVVNRIEGLY